MSNKSASNGELKKTFRFDETDQAAMAALVKRYGFKTESAAIEHILRGYLKLDDRRKELEQQVRQLQEENGRKAGVMRRFNMALSELMAEQLDHHAEPKQSRARFHRIDEEE